MFNLLDVAREWAFAPSNVILPYLLLTMIRILCGLANTYSLGLVATNSEQALGLFATSYVAGHFASIGQGRFTNSLMRHINCASLGTAYSKYSKLSITAKDKNPISGYNAIATSAATTWSILCSDLLSMGVDIFVSVLVAAHALVCVTSTVDWRVVGWLLPVAAELSWLATRALRAMHRSQKAREASARKTRVTTQITLQHLQLGHASLAEAIHCLTLSWPLIDAHRAAGRWLTGVLDCAGALVLVVALSGQSDLLLYSAVAPMINVVHMTVMIYCSFGDAEAAKASYLEFWKENEQFLRDEPTQHPLVELAIESSVLSLSDSGREFVLRVPPLVIPITSRVLVRGDYGGGKSTLVKGLLGLIPGVALAGSRGLTCSNYTKSWVYAPQSLASLLPFTEVTVAQLFRDNDPDRITRAVRIAGATALLRGDSVDPNMRLSGTLSGGQRTAVAVATCLIELLRPARELFPRWLALDECTTGMDPHSGYELINNICEAFPDIPVLVITHLENAETRCRWTHILECAHGRVASLPTR